MQNIMNYIFAALGVVALLYVNYLDKVFPEVPSSERWVTRVIGWYIILAFVWPKQAADVVNRFIDRYLPKWQEKKE